MTEKDWEDAIQALGNCTRQKNDIQTRNKLTTDILDVTVMYRLLHNCVHLPLVVQRASPNTVDLFQGH